MLRSSLLVTVFYGMCCAIAVGQTAPPPTATARTGSSTRERPTPAASPSGPAEAQNSAFLMTQNGGSLLRAGLMTTPDPSRAGLKNVSVFAVPEPEAKTIKKHDL